MKEKIKNWIINLAIKFITEKNIGNIFAKLIAKLLKWASGKSPEKWDIAKSIVTKINVWTGLFLQVYEDDNLSEEEEKLIAEAIESSTTAEKIVDLIQKK